MVYVAGQDVDEDSKIETETNMDEESKYPDISDKSSDMSEDEEQISNFNAIPSSGNNMPDDSQYKASVLS